MLRLDVRFLHRNGYLAGSLCASIQWRVNGHRTSDILIGTSEGERPALLMLNYRFRSHSEEWGDMSEAVRLEWQPCHFGGVRPWLTCPHCDRRVGVLWGAERFLCRHCQRIAYQSQNESRLDRSCNQSRKLRERLGAHLEDLSCSVDQLPRPKGMHHATYDRLVARIAAYDRQWREDMAAQFGGF
jgi:hypothetical protein